MSQLITCKEVSKSFGAQTLFEGINLVVSSGDRIGVIGPNGAGKSTLLKILCELEEPDVGEVRHQKYIKYSYLAQSDTFSEKLTVENCLMTHLQGEDLEETEKYNRVHSLLSRAEFVDSNDNVENLSGGWRKRLAICRSLLLEPDVLVMDEPTNHLDIEGILWLEKMLATGSGPSAFLLVSHDRKFLENCTNRIIELSPVYPEGTFQVEGRYSSFLEQREKFLTGQREEETRLANKARREIEWLRRGPKARTSKAKYRIDEAHKLSSELAEVKARNRALSNVQIDFEATGRKTKKLLEAKGLTKSYGEQLLFKDLDITLSPQTRLGLLGRNGCGKSTLMKLLAAGENFAELNPDGGTIRTADKVQIVNFEQDRKSINPEIILRRALAPDGDSIIYRGRSLHVVSWAKKFLFRPDQLETPVGQLSGGEQARILIAGLMRQPADILLLDEPTNDLDIDSLDVLEASLLDFPGAVVLVTHDRYLLDRVCQSLLGFGGKDKIAFYGDYLQWVEDISALSGAVDQNKKEKFPKSKSSSKQNQPKKKGKLSYMDQREYDQIEDRIGDAEQLVSNLQEKMELPEIVANSEELSRCWEALEQAQQEVEQLYNRWDELEELRNS